MGFDEEQEDNDHEDDGEDEDEEDEDGMSIILDAIQDLIYHYRR